MMFSKTPLCLCFFSILLMLFAMTTFSLPGCSNDDDDDSGNDDGSDNDDISDDDDDDDDYPDFYPLQACTGSRAPCIWTTVLSIEKPLNLYGIWGSSGEDIYAVGGEPTGESTVGTSVILHYDGNQWQELPDQFDITLHDVGGSSADDVYAVGGFRDPAIYHFDGSDWSLSFEMDASATDFQKVWVADQDNAYALCHDGIWYKGSADWVKLDNLPSNLSLNVFGSMWGYSPYQIYMATSNEDTEGAEYNYILTYDGQNWADSSGHLKFMSPHWGGFWGDSTGRVYHVSFHFIHRFENGTWEPIVFLKMGFMSIWGQADDDIYVGNDRGSVLHYNGEDWCEMDTGRSLLWTRDIWGEPGGKLFAVGTTNKEDGGVLMECVPQSRHRTTNPI